MHSRLKQSSGQARKLVMTIFLLIANVGGGFAWVLGMGEVNLAILRRPGMGWIVTVGDATVRHSGDWE